MPQLPRENARVERALPRTLAERAAERAFSQRVTEALQKKPSSSLLEDQG